MPLPTTTTGPTNIYYIIDDSGVSAGSAGGLTGGASAQVLCAEFTAPTLAAAFQAAWVICSALQRPGRLVPKFGSPPFTLVQGNAANLANTSTPSGIGY
jgi:hypothetical protein